MRMMMITQIRAGINFTHMAQYTSSYRINQFVLDKRRLGIIAGKISSVQIMLKITLVPAKCMKLKNVCLNWRYKFTFSWWERSFNWSWPNISNKTYWLLWLHKFRLRHSFIQAESPAEMTLTMLILPITNCISNHPVALLRKWLYKNI